MGYPWALTIIIAVLLYGTVIALFFRRIRLGVGKLLLEFPNALYMAVVALVSLYVLYCAQTGGVQKNSVMVGYFLALPCVLLRHTRGNGNWLSGYDLSAILLFWIPFDLHWVDKRHGQGLLEHRLDWAIIGVSAVVLAFLCWGAYRNLEGMKTKFSLKPKQTARDLSVTLALLLGLAAVVVPAGLATGFLKPMQFLAGLPITELSESIANHLFTHEVAFTWLKIFVTIALCEEFLFRSVLQNFLQHEFPRQRLLTLLLASVLFGSAHLNNGAASWRPQDWNWMYMGFASLAGMAYGLAFRWTSSILYPMALHAAVDAIWHTLFRS